MSASLVLEERIGSSVDRKWLPYLTVWLTPALLTGFLHLNAIGLVDTPGSSAITPLHGIVAALANVGGPWAGHIVAAIDFPNAGLSGFNGLAALGLTLLYITSAGAGMLAERRLQRRLLLGQFVLLTLGWYGYGFSLITDGLL